MGETTEKGAQEAAKLNGAYAFKVGMSQVYDEKGRVVPVTILRWENWVVTQIKTKEKDGYEAVQISSVAKKEQNSSSAEKGHFGKAGAKTGFLHSREVKQSIPEGLSLGQEVTIETFAKGDVVKLTSVSKGKGFQGSVRRWNFAGGPAAHGSKFHRQPGSSGNRTWPGRVMPGKKFPGHLGDETVSLRNVEVVDVMPEEGVILVKGPVPGSRNTIVRILKK